MAKKQIEIDDPRLGPRDHNDLADPRFLKLVWGDFGINNRLADGSILRIFRPSLGGHYIVQKVINPGVRDRRRKLASRESREVLLRTLDRAEAIGLVNGILSAQES